MFKSSLAVCLAALSLGLAAMSSAAGIRVGYLQPHNDSNDNLIDLLGDDPRFDVENSATMASAPTISDLLENYDVLMVSVNSPPNYSGDFLADYVDAGGRLVFTTFLGQSESMGMFEPGRFGDPGYNPLTGPIFDAYQEDDLGDYDPLHPIMDGVASLHASAYEGDYTGVAEGATLVASWASGKPLVALNSAGTIAGVTLSPEFYDLDHATGDYRRLFDNTLAYVASPNAVPEPASMAALGLGGLALLRRRKRA